MTSPIKTASAVLICLLACATWLTGQSSGPPSSSAASASSDTSYPEQAYLSSSRYVNQYFKFTFELPVDVRLQPIPEPASRDGRVSLLDLAGPPPTDARIWVYAIPTSAGKNQDAKSFLRDELDQELYRGVEELRGLSKASIAGHRFYLYETRRGIDQHVLLATELEGYLMEAILASHDEKTLKQLEVSFEHLAFFSPSELHQYQEASAQPYEGPAISSHRLALLQADPPASHIDPGSVQGDFYENPALGFSYRIPQGWVLESQGAVQPAIERDRAREDFGRPRVGAAERKLMQACSRTLFSAWAKRPESDGRISYDDFGEVTVSAISMACFPSLKFPQDSNDRQAFKDFLLQFGLTHPILTEIREGKAFTAGSNVFLFLHGTIGFRIPDDELARRLSIAMAITQRRGYLLTWFFAAPHDSELQQLTQQRVIFDSEPAIKAANAPQPGGGEPSAPAAQPPAAPPAAAPSVPAAPVANASTPADATSQATNSQKAPEPTRPSLLRPGETVESQQGKGTPIVRK